MKIPWKRGSTAPASLANRYPEELVAFAFVFGHELAVCRDLREKRMLKPYFNRKALLLDCSVAFAKESLEEKLASVINE